VKRNRTNKRDSGDPGPLGRSLNSDKPDPEEGRRLVTAFLSIRDAKMRRALIQFAEALAGETAQAQRPDAANNPPAIFPVLS
jgi:hypothetical protein